MTVNILHYFTIFITFMKTNTSIRNGLFILFFAFVLYYIFAFIFNYSFLHEYSTYTNILFIIISTLWLFSIIYNYLNNTETIQNTFFSLSKRILLLSIGISSLIYIIYIISSSELFNTALSTVLFILSIVFILAIISYILSKFHVIQKLKSIPFLNSIYNIVFYIPILITNGILLVKHDATYTPFYVYKLIGILSILIVSYFLIPYIQVKIYNHNGIQLLKNPTYIDNKKTIGTFDKIHNVIISKSNKKYEYNYALSSWIFIENQGYNTTHNASNDTTILSYGNKPRITYNLSTQTMRIFMRKGLHGLKKIYQTNEFKLQKWNNVVLNYKDGICDIFINGILVSSVHDIISYMRFDNITIGEENGIPGSICNVVYYRSPLSKTKIEWLYDRLKNNPCQ